MAFDYDPKTQLYRRVINGVPQSTGAGRKIAAANVLVQFCSVTTYYKDVDVNGSPSKWTHTIGSGKAVLFRNGKRIVGTWTRKADDGGTTLPHGRRQGHALPSRPDLGRARREPGAAAGRGLARRPVARQRRGPGTAVRAPVESGP